MSRSAGQFGFTEGELVRHPKEWDWLRESLHITGIHVYNGTQLSDADALSASFTIAIDAAHRVAEELALDLQVIDCGGGFPWPFAATGQAPGLDALREKLAQLCVSKGSGNEIEYWFESGRYLTASCGTLIASVLDDKMGPSNRRYVVLDAGINALGGMGGLGRMLVPDVSILPLEPASKEAGTPADVVGPLCTPLDVIARNVELPRLCADSLVAIPNVGAYGLTASLIGFLSHAAAAEVVYRDNRVLTARRCVINRERLQ